MTKLIQTGGATFDSADSFCYFLAGPPKFLEFSAPCHPYFLVAVNELRSEESVDYLESLLIKYPQVKLLLDSGIFYLTNEYARKYGVDMNTALSLAPAEIEGFEKLWNRYLVIVNRLENRLWGYIELDQGGRENKIKTRSRLEQAGLRPIPVYHPLNDGWDYFDYLAERYDRICFGNIVQANQETRKRLVATAWERHRKYPHLWIHLLGLTPSELTSAYPINSADSSTWLGLRRWANRGHDSCMGSSAGSVMRDFQYVLGSPANHPDVAPGLRAG